jgi:hypothetical protein
MVKLRFLLISMLILGTLNSSSQSLVRSVISVTGISTINNQGLLSYSAGETITGCLLAQANCITQGFQQPSLFYFFEENVRMGINAVEVYPNPVIKNLTILYYTRTIDFLHVELYSGNGTILRTFEYYVSESGWIDLEMDDLKAGLYLIHIFSTDKVLDTVFKIEKIR